MSLALKWQRHSVSINASDYHYKYIYATPRHRNTLIVACLPLQRVLLAPVVRYGSRANDPVNLYLYLDYCEKEVQGLPPSARRALLTDVFHLLLEACCDCAVPLSWRRLCLDNLYRPLRALSGPGATAAEQRAREMCLRTLSQHRTYLDETLTFPIYEVSP